MFRNCEELLLNAKNNDNEFVNSVMDTITELKNSNTEINSENILKLLNIRCNESERNEVLKQIEAQINNQNSDLGKNDNENVTVNTNENIKTNGSSTGKNDESNPTTNSKLKQNTSTLETTHSSNPSETLSNPFDIIAPISAILIASIMSAILAKNLYDKWKYGKNALKNLKSLKKAISAKNELTNKWMKRRRSANIHAIGVGKIDGTDDYCIQVFVDDANGQMLQNPPTQLLPQQYQDLPIVIYEMPRAEFVGLLGNSGSDFSAEKARQSHQILRGGISGANANLTNEFGTIGYFFRPNFINQAASLWLKKHIYLLSNSHVFSDLTRTEKNDTDLILHPSPGESTASKSIAELYKIAPIIFGGDVEDPNFVDAAIAKLHTGQEYLREIPRIGQILDFLRKEQVELRSDCRKFGRTTGYTQGKIFSIHLSIWVKYSAKGKEAFFKDQFLIIPTDGSSFVKGGDSGSIVVDYQNKAIGLIFAGAEQRSSLQFEKIEDALELENLVNSAVQRVENYGVANSISDVLTQFNIRLDS